MVPRNTAIGDTAKLWDVCIICDAASKPRSRLPEANLVFLVRKN